MALVKVTDLLQDALARKYAVGYFESWNLESTYAVVRAAEKMKAPVLIGFCGEYLDYKERKYTEDLILYATMLKRIASAASVPVAVLLNEADELQTVYRAIAAGFDFVMFVDDEMPLDELIQVQKKIVEFAHPSGIAVEAELGSLPTANQATGEMDQGSKTDPDEALKFVQETGVDALAVAFGSVHLLENKKAELDLPLLETLHKTLQIPLVLHGGTGVDMASFKDAIDLGIAKVNVGTVLKRAVIDAEKQYFAKHQVDSMNPNDILGKGGKFDLAFRGHDAMMEVVIEYIKAFNGENKAR